MKYSRLNPLHWIMALFSNSRKTDYTPAGGDAIFRCPSAVAANTRVCYWFRNPAHDFTHYIIGFVDPDNENRAAPGFRTVYGNAIDTLAPGAIVALRMYKRLPLPFVSYAGHGWLFYLGWRPDGGFGVKVRRG